MGEVIHVGTVHIVQGSEDPLTAGFAAPMGSTFHRNDGISYKKVDAADTAWEIIHTGYDTDTYILPLRGVTDAQIFFTGDFRVEAAGLTGDYSTDFAVSNNHIYIEVNTITTGGDIVLTGISVDESTGEPTLADTETITVDTTAGQKYQSTKKWWEITNVDVTSGTIDTMDYDVGILGYSDLVNRVFKISAYRLDAFAQGANADFRFRLRKIQNDGNKKFSIVDLEDIGVDSNAAGNQIVDTLRSIRDVDPAVASIWADDSMIVFKQLDFDAYFSSDEHHIDGSNDEGFMIDIQGQGDAAITNVDYIILKLRIVNL